MNNKNKSKWKRFVGCVSAIAMLFGSIPVNTLVASAEGETEPTYVNVLDNENISLHGVTYGETEQAFIRMDSETAAGIANTESLYDEDGAWVNTVYSLAREAAGGRIRFQTNSTYVAIKATLTIHDASHLSHGGKMEAAKYGFDVYVDSAEGSVYAGTVCGEAPTKNPDGSLSTTEVLVEGTVNLGETADRDLTIYFPITSETKSVEIDVAEGSTIAPHETDYTEGKHLVFYGSSITQGGAVTKPGNTYVNTVGRNMNMEYTNFGMWGRCKGEPAFANYIAGLGNISAFVYDFDHNISKVYQMEPVHYPFYETVRAAYPDIPIIMITRPGNNLDNTAATDPSYSTTAEMKEVIYKSYQKAVAAGDENVHFIDGESFFGYSTAYMADGSHPNDAGQARMAEVVTSVLQRAFAGEKNVVVTPANCPRPWADDFEKGAGNWDVATDNNATATDFGVKTVDGNNVYQLQLVRGSSSSQGCYIKTKDNILSGVSEFTIETKGTASYSTDGAKTGWSYPTLSIMGDAVNNRFNLQLQPTINGCKVIAYDRTDGKNETLDTYEFTNLKVEGVKGEIFSFDLKTDVKITETSTGGKNIAFSITMNEEEPIEFNYDIKNKDFEPQAMGYFLLTAGSEGGTFTATVDDIKVSRPGQHTINPVAEIPATPESEGKSAHFACDYCGQQFLDENGILKTTDAELTTARLVPCATLYTNYGPATNDAGDFVLKASAQVTSVNDAWQIQGPNGAYVIIEDRTESNTKIMGANNNFGFKMDTTLYRDANDDWTYTGLLFRKATGAGAGYYDLRIEPTSTGYSVDLRNGSGVQASANVEDDKFASLYEEGTEISYQVRLVTDFNEDGTEADFCICIDDNDVLVLHLDEPIESWKAETARIYLYSTSDATGLKAVVDNIEVYETKHTLNCVEGVPATTESAGTRTYYECSNCNKKFSDEFCSAELADTDIVIPQLSACTTFFTNDCTTKDGWTEKNDAVLSNSNGAMVIEGTNGSTSAYIMSASKIMADAGTDFCYKMDTTLYKDTNGDWTYAGLLFRKVDSPSNRTYEVQIVPTQTGYTVQLRSDNKAAGEQEVTNDEFANLYENGQEISYQLCVVIDTDVANGKVDIFVYVDNQAVSFEIENSAWVPETARVYLYTTGDGAVYKVAVDNMRAYKTTHDVTAVEATPSTDAVAGVKAHYKCSDCEKKFMDEEATVVATDAALEYWKLSDVLCQTRENKTNPSNTDVRFVFYVDDYTKYSGVKFTITCGDKSNSAITKNVYQKVYAGNKLYATQDLYGVTNGYFTTFILSNCNDALLAQGMTVKVTLICTDGTEIPYNESTKTFPQ